MVGDLRRRVQLLEQRRHAKVVQRYSSIVTYDPDTQTPEQAIEGRQAAPGYGLVLLPNVAESVEDWERLAVAGQQRLLERAAQVLAGKPDPGPVGLYG